MIKCQTCNFVLGFCTVCLWPEISGGDIETSKDALLDVDILRHERGISESDAIKIVHARICKPSTRAGKAGKDGFADR
jgi:hypothetical protein